MDNPKINTAIVYGAVARLLPLEGRDFKIDAGYEQDGKVKIIIDPITAIGRAWVPFLQKELEAPMAHDGISVYMGGITEQERVTVNTIREKVEQEAKIALQKKIEEAEAERKKKSEEADTMKKKLSAQGGEDAPLPDELRKAYMAASRAGNEAYRLHRVEQKVAVIRADVNRAANKVAKEDEAAGRVWAIDMDEPLTSLFDRQDVEEKLRAKEEAILELANRAVAMDDIRNSAINVAKQYIIQKEA